MCVDISALCVAGVRVARRRAVEELLRVHAQRGPQRAEHARRVRGQPRLAAPAEADGLLGLVVLGAQLQLGPVLGLGKQQVETSSDCFWKGIKERTILLPCSSTHQEVDSVGGTE